MLSSLVDQIQELSRGKEQSDGAEERSRGREHWTRGEEQRRELEGGSIGAEEGAGGLTFGLASGHWGEERPAGRGAPSEEGAPGGEGMEAPGREGDRREE